MTREQLRNSCAIWWLSHKEMEAVDRQAFRPIPGPEYLERQWQDRYGRPGRGRLWLDNQEFSDPENFLSVDPWPKTPLSQALENTGGIVIHREDIAHLAEWPGILTDFELNRLA